jgi:hypothetical protein
VSIGRRLDDLERAMTPSCPECGLSANGEPAGPVVFGKIDFDVDTSGIAPLPEPCSTCGRMPHWFTLKIGIKQIVFDNPREVAL